MERKTFLAIALSFLFLISYNSLVVSPQQKTAQLNQTQPIQNIDVTIKNTLDSPVSPTATPSVTEELAETDQEETIGSFRVRFSAETGVIKEIFSEEHQYAPILSNYVDLPQDIHFKSLTTTTDSIIFLYENSNGQVRKELKAIDNNKLTVLFKFSGLSNLQNVQFTAFGINAHRIKNDQDTLRDSMLLEYSWFIDNKVIRKNNAFKFSEKEKKAEQKAIEWFGWRDRYHFTIIKPEFKVSAFSVVPIDDHRIHFEVKPTVDGTSTFAFSIYIGPQDLNLLKSLDGNLNKIMAFSAFPLLDMVEKFIYNVLLAMNKVIPNWGICIILISLIIYGVTYPLTLKSMLSMKKMQEVQPKMAELREKYKNDPQKLNTEVVQLYRTHNINPLAGCLPMLLQMPVFISLYQVLWRTHNFEGAQFLWIKDLSLPDKLFVFNGNLPFIGNEINILPVFMTIVMFFQQKLSSKTMVVTDPSQEMQQKMMMYIFPIFIGGIFYHFASGLTLYFTVFYLLSTLTQYKMSKYTPAKK